MAPCEVAICLSIYAAPMPGAQRKWQSIYVRSVCVQLV